MTPISPTKFANAEYKHSTYAVYPEEGSKFEDLLNPDCWVHVAGNLKVMDRIEVYPADLSYYAELIVLAPGRTFAKVGLLFKTDLATVAPEEDTGEYELKLRGPKKWSAVHKGNKTVLFEGFDRREDAQIELANHLKAMAA